MSIDKQKYLRVALEIKIATVCLNSDSTHNYYILKYFYAIFHLWTMTFFLIWDWPVLDVILV